MLEKYTFSRLSIFPIHNRIKRKHEETLQYDKFEVFETRGPNTLKVNETVQKIRQMKLNLFGEYSIMSIFLFSKRIALAHLGKFSTETQKMSSPPWSLKIKIKTLWDLGTK
jgi:hypothetical protein